MSNTINLMEGFASKLELKMARESHVWGKAKGKYDWTGLKTVKSITPITQTPNDYNPQATGSRFGALAEVEDSLNTYTLQFSKSNNMSIDKEYNTEQKMLKRAGTILKYQINQEYVPMMDRECLSEYAGTTGVVHSTDGEITSSNVSTKITNARKSFVNNHVYGNGNDLVMWVKTSIYNDAILHNSEFIYLDKVKTKALIDAAVGKLGAFQVIEVADEDMPANVNFICANLNCLLNPTKFKTLRILKTHPDVDGAVLQPHFVYGAFVERANVKGVYVSNVQAPSI